MEKMRKTLLAIVIIVFIPNLVSSAEPARASKPMFKGVELYSWKVSSNNTWRFSLCLGTNRNKSLSEIKRHCQKVNNVSSLKNSLSKLAVGEYVMWSSPFPELTLPPEAVLLEVQALAISQQISLTIAK